jgi:hypothetical protein
MGGWKLISPLHTTLLHQGEGESITIPHQGGGESIILLH